MLAIKKPVDPANPNFYLSKPQMHAALVEYRDLCEKAAAAGEELPGVSDYLGSCFLRIAQGLGMKHNFRNYSFVNDMISDAVITCLKYVKSYDPGRTNADTGLATSPLSYFTQCCHFAFINRINIEAKQSKIKRAMIYAADLDSFDTQDDDAGEFRLNLSEFIAGLGKDEVEEMMPKKKVKAEPKGGLEGFFG